MRNILPNIDSEFTDVFFTNLSNGEKIEVDSLRINNFSKSSLLDILNEQPNAYRNNRINRLIVRSSYLNGIVLNG